VLLIDLDHFKSINDRFGHALGDRVLEIFTDSARQSVRASDLIGRLGGEEFAAVLTNTSKDTALAVAERIRECFAAAALEVESRPVGATVSIGLVHYEGAALDIAELLAQADQALYVAKERGRNRIEIASLDLMLARAQAKSASGASSVAAMGAKNAA
jgi:diguanylate cyclase (GGDEF)-like protein